MSLGPLLRSLKCYSRLAGGSLSRAAAQSDVILDILADSTSVKGPQSATSLPFPSSRGQTAQPRVCSPSTVELTRPSRIKQHFHQHPSVAPFPSSLNTFSMELTMLGGGAQARAFTFPPQGSPAGAAATPFATAPSRALASPGTSQPSDRYPPRVVQALNSTLCHPSMHLAPRLAWPLRPSSSSSSLSSVLWRQAHGASSELVQARPSHALGQRAVSTVAASGEVAVAQGVDVEVVDLVSQLEQALGTPLSSSPLVSPHDGLVVVLSGPSGVGKDAVIQCLQQVRPDLHFVVTATSRAMRPGEVHGKDYMFVTKDAFESMIEQEELLEHAVVYGEYKGIPKDQIRSAVSQRSDVVLRLDVQGAATVRRLLGGGGVFIFLTAESEAALVHRLVGRKTEPMDKLIVRVGTARQELERVHEFDYVVVNEDGCIDRTVRELCAIIDAEKLRVHRKPARL